MQRTRLANFYEMMFILACSRNEQEAMDYWANKEWQELNTFLIKHMLQGHRYVYCNRTLIFGEPRKYLLGDTAPNYPVPAKIGTVSSFHSWEDGEASCIMLHHANAEFEEPLVTWWNESFGLELPTWHSEVNRWEYPEY